MNHSLGNVLNHHQIKHLWAANHFLLRKDYPRVKQTQKECVDQDFRLLVLSRNDYLTAYSRRSDTRG